LGVSQALGVSLLAEASLPEASNIGGQLVFSSGRLSLNLVHVGGEQLVDLGLEGVELLNGLLEDVADHQLGAVVGVQLEGRVEHGIEGINNRGLTLSES
jgi:hypothetical protein